MALRWARAISAALAAAAAGALYLSAASDPLTDFKGAVAAFEAKRYAAASVALESLGLLVPVSEDEFAELCLPDEESCRRYRSARERYQALYQALILTDWANEEERID